MAITIGNAGLSTFKRGALLLAGTTLLATVAAGIVVDCIAYMAGTFSWVVVFATAPIVAAELWFFRGPYAEIVDLFREGENWLKGGTGELLTYQELRHLPDEFAVFNDIHPVVGGRRAQWNIDHIVVGPTGIFVIETKNLKSGKIFPASVDRFTRKHVDQVNRNAMGFKADMIKWSGGDLASVFVVPVLVYAQDGVYVERLQEGSVRVLPRSLLVRSILRHSERHIDMDRAHRVARVVFEQMQLNDRVPFEQDLRRYGEIAREVQYRVRSERDEACAEPVNQETAARSCPKCGAELVERTAKQGPHKGNSFLACPKYPDCRHTEPLPPHVV
jgi:hypothetical protein